MISAVATSTITNRATFPFTDEESSGSKERLASSGSKDNLAESDRQVSEKIPFNIINNYLSIGVVSNLFNLLFFFCTL